MGVADVTSKVLLEFKADTRQAKKAVKGLAGEQKKSAQAALKAQEKQNAAVKGSIASLGKLAIGVGAVVGAYKSLSASVTFYAKRSQLAAASAGADIGKIQAAANGLITEQEALQFAAAAMNTEFKLSQKEMEGVARFMIVLRNQGNDLKDVQTRLTQAIVEGNSRALRPFGVIVDGSTGKLKTQQAILTEITKQNEAFAGSLDLAGDSAARMAIKIEDATDRMKNKLGQFVENIAITLEDDPFEIVRQNANRADLAFRQAIEHALILAQFSTPEALAARRKFMGGVQAIEGRLGAFDTAAASLLRTGRDRGGGAGTRKGGGKKRRRRGLVETEGVSFGGTGEFSEGLGIEGDPTGLGALGGPEGIAIPEVPPEVAASVKDVRTEIEFLGDAMAITGGAITSGFEAWGAGAIGLGDAMKQALGNALGDVLMGEAMKHLALAAAAATVLNPKAFLHLAAAAGLAAASGKVRNFLGGSGGGTSAGGGGGRAPGASAGGFGGGGGGSNREQIFVVEVPFSDSPRRRRKEISDAITRSRNQQRS